MKDFLILTTIATVSTLVIYSISIIVTGEPVPMRNIYIGALLGALFAHTTQNG